MTPAALRDLRLGLPTLDHRNEASRVLAVCLRCCWSDLAGEPWPGRETSVAAVMGMLAELLPTRLPQTHHRFAVEAFRQLNDSGWLRWRERAGTIRLGPRVAGWPVAELEALRELCRTMPTPPMPPEKPRTTGSAAADATRGTMLPPRDASRGTTSAVSELPTAAPGATRATTPAPAPKPATSDADVSPASGSSPEALRGGGAARAVGSGAAYGEEAGSTREGAG